MVKNSFTLFETLLSITLLIIIISGFFNSSYYDEKAINNSSLLNSLENKFTLNDFTTFLTTNTKINIIKNDSLKEEITVKKHSFENEDIKIFIYEK
ncbi:hypothetical protein [Poseidonibacter ostreae]|uniref:Prepilin-type N-terminal cleavage/methylation domain-containing protein n=1 Tax=Poseidonibacter ostreae TaxID=2654171 RepID=A0A6L4WRN1_9BACT|nr:hypothetical protein [Poseidonibacter ostreae]KAB7883157.1 hypothetical protein GA417_12855 [Poseidonibacter ostreae]KAB7885144.1 hypothetical protein GBG19_14690 [Poseidonibacter ostreae]KAB7887620.1 hypothetical protein GBG18_13815 [Poseidonibacter ostreae]MAC83320.1 hypothetical protein [Arcobacter sp.]